MQEVDVDLEKLLRFKSETERLKKIVSEVFEIDVMVDSRLSKSVDARKAYAKILHELKYTIVSIGKALNRDHSTIHYYIRTDGLFEYDIELTRKYIECRDAFLEDRDPMTKNQIERLILDKYSVIKIQQKYKRLSRIIDLIDRVTFEGKEDVMEQRISDMIKMRNYGEAKK